MPSISGKTKIRRKARAKKMGRPRKRLNRHGTTPAFPIHQDQAPNDERQSSEA